MSNQAKRKRKNQLTINLNHQLLKRMDKLDELI